MVKPNEQTRTWHSTSEYQQDNWSELLPFSEFTYNNTPSATTGITPFFANKSYHLNLIVHPKCHLASAQACDFVTEFNDYTSSSGSTLLKLNVETKSPLIPENLWLQNSRLEAKHSSRLKSFI